MIQYLERYLDKSKKKLNTPLRVRVLFIFCKSSILGLLLFLSGECRVHLYPIPITLHLLAIFYISFRYNFTEAFLAILFYFVYVTCYQNTPYSIQSFTNTFHLSGFRMGFLTIPLILNYYKAYHTQNFYNCFLFGLLSILSLWTCGLIPFINHFRDYPFFLATNFTIILIDSLKLLAVLFIIHRKF